MATCPRGLGSQKKGRSRPSAWGRSGVLKSGEALEFGLSKGRRRRLEKICRRSLARISSASRRNVGGQASIEERHGADIHWPQARSQGLRARQGSRRDAESDRGAEGLLRPVSSHGPAEGRPSERGAAGGVQVGVPDQGFRRHRPSRVRQVRVRSAEIRRRRVPPARHDLRRSAQGDAATHRVRRRSRDAGQIRQGHQGAGRLHGRHAAHDRERHLHRQRHRARHRLADAPQPRRVLRSRQGQEPFLGQALVRRPHHPLSRLVARHRVRRQGHRLRAHRSAPQDSGDLAPLCARPRRRGDPGDFLSPDRLQPSQGRLARAFRRRAHEGNEGLRRHDRRRHRRGRDRGRQEAHRARGASARREGAEGAARNRRGPLRPVYRRGPLQPADRRNLRRGRRRDHREVARSIARGRLRRVAYPRHRPCQRRRIHPQHAESRQELVARGRPVRHLSRHASGRAADDRKRRGDVPVAVLRRRAL